MCPVSSRPAIHSAAKARRHFLTVLTARPTARAAPAFDMPSAHAKTIRVRSAGRGGLARRVLLVETVRKTGYPGCSGGDGLQVSIVKGWIALVAHSLGRIDVVGKSVAGLSEPVHLIVQSPQP